MKPSRKELAATIEDVTPHVLEAIKRFCPFAEPELVQVRHLQVIQCQHITLRLRARRTQDEQRWRIALGYNWFRVGRASWDEAKILEQNELDTKWAFLHGISVYPENVWSLTESVCREVFEHHIRWENLRHTPERFRRNDADHGTGMKRVFREKPRVLPLP